MRYIFACLIILCIGSCSTKTKEESCRFGSPTAMFSDTYEKVKTHDFKQEGQKAFEEIVFENNMQLAIQQSGCDKIKQVFQLNMPGGLEGQSPDYFKQVAIGLFRYLGTVSDEHFTFNQFANLMTEQADTITLGKPFELAPSYYIKVDKVLGAKNGLLLVELSSDNK